MDILNAFIQVRTQIKIAIACDFGNGVIAQNVIVLFLTIAMDATTLDIIAVV